jgi:hypothetical protein
MATTSPFKALPFTLGAGSLMGQGTSPEIQVLYSTAAATATPTWHDATHAFRGWTTSRGRETELDRVAGGAATVTLDNRTNQFGVVGGYANLVHNPRMGSLTGSGADNWANDGTLTGFTRYGSIHPDFEYAVGGLANATTVYMYHGTGASTMGAVVAGQIVSVGGYVQRANTGVCQLALQYWDATMSTSSFHNVGSWNVTANTATWLGTSRHVAPAGFVYVRPLFYFDGVVSGSTGVFVTGAVVRHGDFSAAGASAYADGSMQGYSWAGTPELSQTYLGGGPPRPMNRWWIRSRFSGVTKDIFKGYAEKYDQQWPTGAGMGTDALTVVSCADELKILNLDQLPTMDPPRDTYEDLVKFDNPQGYWMLHDNDASGQYPSHGSDGSTYIGQPLVGGTTVFVTSPIIGDASQRFIGTANLRALRTDTYISTANAQEDGTGKGDSLNDGGPGDASSLAGFTFETWLKSDEALPSGARGIANGPLSAGASTWSLSFQSSGAITASLRNSGGTNHTASTAAGAMLLDTWFHLAYVFSTSNTITIYVNGVAAGSTGFSGSVGAMDAGSFMRIGQSGAFGGNRSYDEVAWYRFALPAARLLAHYVAGTQRGFPAQDPGARINAVLDLAAGNASRNIRAGSRELHPVFTKGQAPLDELRRAESGEAVDAVLFVAKDGTVTFLDDGHRSVSPWSTIQATFDDDGTDLPYLSLEIDYSESFLFNKWSVTRTGGTTTTVSDAASIGQNFQRPQSLTDLPITTDSDQSAIASAMLAKYKDPMQRVVGLALDTSVPNVTEAVLALEVGDRIRVSQTPRAGSTRIDQTLFVQKIATSGANDQRPWSITLGVSPL